jgi:ParB family chromosome partitioning protein
MKQARLGRGLSALLGDYAGARNAIESGDTVANATDAPSTEDLNPSEIAIDRIVPNPKQPRRTFVEADLEELTKTCNARISMRSRKLKPTRR